jgi:hypothetical protein
MSLDVMQNYYLIEQPNDPELANVFLGLRGRAQGEAMNEYFH